MTSEITGVGIPGGLQSPLSNDMAALGAPRLSSTRARKHPASLNQRNAWVSGVPSMTQFPSDMLAYSSAMRAARSGSWDSRAVVDAHDIDGLREGAGHHRYKPYTFCSPIWSKAASFISMCWQAIRRLAWAWGILPHRWALEGS